MSSSLATLAIVVMAIAGLIATTAANAEEAAAVSSPVAAAAAALTTTAAQVVVRGRTGGRSELDAVRGQCDLTDGRLLSVAPRGLRLVAKPGPDPQPAVMSASSGSRRDAAVALQSTLVPQTLHA